jgi:hypothetical protein
MPELQLTLQEVLEGRGGNIHAQYIARSSMRTYIQQYADTYIAVVGHIYEHTSVYMRFSWFYERY